MAASDKDNDQYGFNDDAGDDQSVLSTRGIEAFGRKVTTTASHLIGPLSEQSGNGHGHYHGALAEVHKQLRRPNVQRSMFSMAKTTPTDLVRSKLSKTEIQHRALTYLPDELLANIPEGDNSFSLFQGFKASFPELTEEGRKHRRRVSRGRKLLDETAHTPGTPQELQNLKKDKASMMHELEMLGVRKNMASSEIRDIDNKIANLHGMRRIILDRLANLEQEETMLEHDLMDTEARLEEAQELFDEAESIAINTPTKTEEDLAGDQDESGFMSQSVYEKLPSASNTPASKQKKKVVRRKSMPILHEHFEPGTAIREIRAHQDTITALDFDAPFGTMVTSAMDDSIKVWDLNAGRCIGLLEGHTASVRTLQVEDNFLVTGGMDATIRLWDLSKAHYDPHGSQFDDDEDGIAFENPDDSPVEPPAGSMRDCPLYTLQSHVDEITALHFRNDILVSGSADKTLRQWDLENGRCVQTLDVMWAAAQASANFGSDSSWRQTSRAPAQTAHFIGALQVFETALACGTADGMVRLWDLRSGQVHRSLVGHTGPVTCLQFDDVHLVTGSMDRSIRIWDLRTGSIYDAYAYDNAVTSMMFDERRIVSAAGEDVVKVYDKVEGRQWECGAGIAEADDNKTPAVVERVRVKDGYLVEGRQDGIDFAAGDDETLKADGVNALTEDLFTRYSKLARRTLALAHSPADEEAEEMTRLLDEELERTYKRFYDFVYAELPFCWRVLYTELSLMKFVVLVTTGAEKMSDDAAGEELLDELVGVLDKALILAGGAGRRRGRRVIERLLSYLDAPTQGAAASLPETFPTERVFTPPVTRPIEVVEGLSMAGFQRYLDSAGDLGPEPVVLRGLLTEWPALSSRPWDSPAYLMSRTCGGRRLVPVEVGRSYVDEGWTQELIPFKELLGRIAGEKEKGKTTYLAQHELFTQLPCLQNDILTPDHCFTAPPPHPLDHSKDKPELALPLVNAWFGPPGTITPLHTDGYHNLLCQVVGAKYLRLYAPHDSEALCPRGEEEVDMSNTSGFDVGAVEGWDEDAEGRDAIELEEFRGLRHWDYVLEKGDVLYIPMGWWHYVRSLSVSFSVSFWWNGDHVEAEG
ncbi:Mitochondrial division protein 1 [Colletotrichum gloeosporioides]|uniref:Mitochondrial division protein 1 n=1 Tax=Colletotrichum gloeosporioides TaxID=474922 RepID=A0A8H4CMB0_COLGL|nr:Mitochondrial division protein 1 [Colletotrichum gloeosporioides]KAF3806595.1 Mitochondrial division protein 1 [Colletotrichum gloeosporioides]